MNPRVDFWRDQSNWPRDGGEFIFLARAANALGRSIFGTEWSEVEFATEFPQSLPAIPPKFLSGLSYFAHNLLMSHRPEFKRQPLSIPARSHPSGFAPMPLPIEFSTDEWAAALEISKSNYERAKPALMRAGRVQQRISEMAATGILKTALRAKAGGSFYEVPAEWWNTERTHCRFDFCQMNPKKPFGNGSAGDHYCWIFVEREGLLKQTTLPKEEPELVKTLTEKALRRTVADKRDIFAEWRKKCGKDIPTIAEDVAAMKKQGINRDDTRQLRKDFPARPSGSPKKRRE